MDNKLIWRALEYKKREKTADWYWAVVLIAVSIAVISFFMHNALFGLLIIISAGTLLFFSMREPKIVEIELNEKGIRLDKELFPYVSLEAFWVEGDHENDERIILKSKKTVMPLIVVPIQEYRHEDVRNYLLDYLTEKEMQEPVSQKIMEKLGF